MLATLVLWTALFAASWMQVVSAALVILILLFTAAVGTVIAAVFEIFRYSRTMPSIVTLIAGIVANPATLLVASGFSFLATGNPAD